MKIEKIIDSDFQIGSQKEERDSSFRVVTIYDNKIIHHGEYFGGVFINPKEGVLKNAEKGIKNLKIFMEKFSVSAPIAVALGGVNDSPIGDLRDWAKMYELPFSAKNWLEKEENLHLLLKEGKKCFKPERVDVTEESKLFVCKNPITKEDLFVWSPFGGGVMVHSEQESSSGLTYSIPLFYGEGVRFSLGHKARGIEFIYESGKMYALFS